MPRLTLFLVGKLHHLQWQYGLGYLGWAQGKCIAFYQINKISFHVATFQI